MTAQEIRRVEFICCRTVLFWSIFFDFSSTTLEISLFLSSPVRRLNFIVLDSLFKIEKFLSEMAIFSWDLNSKRTKSFFLCQLNWLNIYFSLFCLILEYFDLSALPWIHCALWSAFGLLRKILQSLLPPHSQYHISVWPCPKHNTRRRSLSMLVLSSSDTHNLNGCMGCCGCHEILIALTALIDVFCLDHNNSQLNRNFVSGSLEKRSEMTVKYGLGTQNNKCWCVKGYGATKCWSFVVLLSCSRRIYLICCRQPLKSVCFSVWKSTLVAFDSLFEIE